jgi:glycosyltransferase involved in cell wall biosynthesis
MTIVPKPLAFVVQRYGPEVNGGAELLCRKVAERLNKSVPVEVLTTCALDHVTWRNEYPAGETTIHSIPVRRFPVDYKRRQNLFRFLSLLTAHLRPRWLRRVLPRKSLQALWMRVQGPYSTPLFNFLKKHAGNYAGFVFFTYLYCTTYYGLPPVAAKSLLVPAAHDEPYLYLGIFRNVFCSPLGIIFSSPEERDLVHRVFENEGIPSAVLGIGIEAPSPTDETVFRRKYGVQGDYLLYVGRVDRAKRCPEMFKYFLTYIRKTGKTISLVLVGRPTIPIPKHPRIASLGFVPEEDKWEAIAGCLVNVIPSKYESLSLTLLEGWALGKPALVNGRCEVLKGHIQRCGGGLWYEDYETFEQGLNHLLDSTEAVAMGEKGKAYVQENYRWDRVIQGYQSMLAKIEAKN